MKTFQEFLSEDTKYHSQMAEFHTMKMNEAQKKKRDKEFAHHAAEAKFHRELSGRLVHPTSYNQDDK